MKESIRRVLSSDERRTIQAALDLASSQYTRYAAQASRPEIAARLQHQASAALALSVELEDERLAVLVT